MFKTTHIRHVIRVNYFQSCEIEYLGKFVDNGRYDIIEFQYAEKKRLVENVNEGHQIFLLRDLYLKVTFIIETNGDFSLDGLISNIFYYVSKLNPTCENFNTISNILEDLRDDRFISLFGNKSPGPQQLLDGNVYQGVCVTLSLITLVLIVACESSIDTLNEVNDYYNLVIEFYFTMFCCGKLEILIHLFSKKMVHKATER